MKMNKMEVLEKDEIELIHNSTIELLERVGVIVESSEARDLLKESGAIVDETNKNNFVKFPESLITEQLKKVPNEFSLWGPDGSFSFNVNTRDTVFATVGTPEDLRSRKEKWSSEN